MLDTKAVADKIVVLKCHYPTANLTRVLMANPKVLLQSQEDISQNAAQVCHSFCCQHIWAEEGVAWRVLSEGWPCAARRDCCMRCGAGTLCSGSSSSSGTRWLLLWLLWHVLSPVPCCQRSAPPAPPSV
jgi:hypothetical protein